MLLYRTIEHRILELKRNIIQEKRKMNTTLRELIQTNTLKLSEPELHYERMACVIGACKRYNIDNELSRKAKKLLNKYIESRVCIIIEREQYETECLHMRDQIQLINR